ncbi:cell division transport system permease protein [Loktanella sp. PT4BL]|jgi:cell division transport system permease protein|uniref:cell division protein FtsX n=1 Tax=Loktanella sp. PT4BL TaxID=2135611 RepID=UPI000D76F189|nr:FtsX-like permease family protein [Loktanella sp. PT4BL]PXW68677.1 cell division transport system permease protein [Loktanella sp. PT4BL]
MKALLELMLGDPQADRAVPQTGMTVRLTVFVAAVMAFLAVITLAVSLTTNRVASLWAADLAQSATLRLPADPATADALLLSALDVLETTPGVTRVRALSQDEQQALLEPWFGPDLPLDALPVPQLIEIVTDGDDFDVEGLRARLSAQVPGAILDDHTAWRAPLLDAAARVRLIGWSVIVLIGATVAAMITLAAQAALAANARIIAVLRLVGAKDAYIARAFVRRFTLRAAGGALVGTLIGLGVVSLMPQGDATSSLLLGVGFEGGEWVWPLLIPVMAAIVAFFATRAAAFRRLREQT